MMNEPRPASVLLVEDSEDDAFFFERALQSTGLDCEVTHLVDGAQAIDFLSSAKSGGNTCLPDIIFLDLKLPVHSGFEVLEWLIQERFVPPLRVSVLSGSDHVGDVQRAQRLGISDYLVKPVKPEQLSQSISELRPQCLEAVSGRNK